MRNGLLNMILMIPAMLIAFTFHEYAHALVADRLGDKTPRFQGRLTLNPVAHIDLFGFVAVLLFGFGWAKPVQTNPSAYKNYRKDDLKVSLAGVIANFLVAVAASIIYALYIRFAYAALPEALGSVLKMMISQIIIINVNIGVFNLIPIPGLDGFSILRDLAPAKFYKFEEKFYQYQMLILLLLVFFGGRIISIPCNIIINWMQKIINIILTLL